MVDVERLLDELELDCELLASGEYCLTVCFDDERKQRVYLSEVNIEGVESPICRISSCACSNLSALSPDCLRKCLINSGKHRLGAWELRDDSLFFSIKTVEKISCEALLKLINYAALAADEFEKKYLGDDRH